MQTASEIAALFGNIDHLSGDKIPSLTRRIKHFYQSGLIEADAEPRDARNTQQFDIAEICKARLLSALSDLGIGGKTLELAALAMSPRPDGMLQDPMGNTRPFWSADKLDVPPASHHWHLPKYIRKGEKVKLALTITEKHGERSISGGFVSASILLAEPGLTASKLGKFRESQGIEAIGKFELNVSALVLPILKAIG